MKKSVHQYVVGGYAYRVEFCDETNGVEHIPSSEVFEREVDDSDVLFTLHVDDAFKPSEKGEEIGTFDSAGNLHEVYKKPDGGYQILVIDYCGRQCCLIESNADFSEASVKLQGDWAMRNFGINNCLMMMYAFAGADKGVLLMHSSVVSKDGKGYMFLGESGTGKSTHTANWLKYIEGTDLMNDDNPVMRVFDGETRVYGSPWSGKTPCYKDVEAPVAAMVQLKQAPYNKIKRLGVIDAYTNILQACSIMKWDRRIHTSICDTISKILSTTPVFFLENLPNEAAVRMSYEHTSIR